MGRAVIGTLGATGLVVGGAVVTGAGLVVGGVVVVVVSSVLPAGRLVPFGEVLLDGAVVFTPPLLVGDDGFEPEAGVDVTLLPPGTLLTPGAPGTVVPTLGSVMTVTTTPSGVVTAEPSGVVTTAAPGSSAMRSDSRDELWITIVPTATIMIPAPTVVAMVRRRRTCRTRPNTCR